MAVRTIDRSVTLAGQKIDLRFDNSTLWKMDSLRPGAPASVVILASPTHAMHHDFWTSVVVAASDSAGNAIGKPELMRLLRKVSFSEADALCSLVIDALREFMEDSKVPEVDPEKQAADAVKKPSSEDASDGS